MDSQQRDNPTLPGQTQEIEDIDLKYEKYRLVQSTVERIAPSTNRLIESQVEDLEKSAFQFERLKQAEISCCLLALLGFGCGAITYDLEYVHSVYDERKDTAASVTIAGTASTFLLLLAIWWRTRQELRWMQAKGFYSYQDDLFTTQKIRWFLLEIAINLPHPIHWLDRAQFAYYNGVKDVTINYTYNAWLSVFVLARIYHIIRVISVLSPYRSGRAQRVCRINGVYPGSWFAVKCLIKERPYHALAAMLLVGMLVGAFLLRVFERPMEPYTDMDYGMYANAMWNVLVTMTTVGYGDYYPVTLLGRISGIAVCFWGVLCVSMIIVTVTTMLNLDSSEEKALLILDRLSFKKDLRVSAANVLTAALHFRSLLKKGAPAIDVELQKGKINRFVSEFQSARNKQRALYGNDSHSDIVERGVNDIDENIQGMRKQLDRIEAMLARSLGAA